MDLRSTASLRVYGRLYKYRQTLPNDCLICLWWHVHVPGRAFLSKICYMVVEMLGFSLWRNLHCMLSSVSFIVVDSSFATKSFTADFTSLAIWSSLSLSCLSIGRFQGSKLCSLSLTLAATTHDCHLVSLSNRPFMAISEYRRFRQPSPFRKRDRGRCAWKPWNLSYLEPCDVASEWTDICRTSLKKFESLFVLVAQIEGHTSRMQDQCETEVGGGEFCIRGRQWKYLR